MVSFSLLRAWHVHNEFKTAFKIVIEQISFLFLLSNSCFFFSVCNSLRTCQAFSTHFTDIYLT